MRTKKLFWKILSFFIAAALFLPCAGCAGPKPYGVFIGLDPEDARRAAGYDCVVIDAAYYDADDIAALHGGGQAVYTYLNVGALEQFRDYYAAYEGLALGTYEDWPDEVWIDVSQQRWRDFLVRELAGGLAGKGVDGFFLDNLDVYGLFPSGEIYDGLVDILQGLHDTYGLPLMVNGGDAFMDRLIGSGDKGLVGAVNQECVFTKIDFETDTYAAQDEEETLYYQDYLARSRDAGYGVYLTEYAASGEVAAEIQAYCQENGYTYFISQSKELDGAA